MISPAQSEALATQPQTAPTLEFALSGLSCQGCARHTTEAIQGVPGVASALVNLEVARASVRWRPEASPDPEAVVRAVRAAGYQARFLTPAQPAAPAAAWSPLAGWQFNVVLGTAVTAPLMAGDWMWDLGGARWFQWVSLVLALPVQVLCGARFYKGAWNQLKVGGSNMDTLVALGSTTAFAYSLWALLAAPQAHLYFMEAAAIITLISIGHWFEAKASARAASSLRALLHLAPATARRLEPDGTATEVPVAQLTLGHRVLLKPGDRVPTDAEVLEGASAVDEAMLTGESLPVEKGPGARLYAGTVNQSGRLVARVEATGEATALAQIIAVVQRAQSSRASIQRLGDRVSAVFVPVVVLVAVGTALWWGVGHAQAVRVCAALQPWLWHVALITDPLAAAILHAAAVLIVACPCAMGLATPAAIMAGDNAAARRGILIRDGIALEKTGRITAVLFDKTGTLTEGRPAVAALVDLRPPDPRATPLTTLVANLAAPSNHPLSRALATLPSDPSPATAPALPALADWQEVRGAGVMATWTGESDSSGPACGGRLRLGSLAWLRESGVGLAAGEAFAAQWTAQGASLLGLATDDRLLGLFALRDPLKPGAAAVIARLTAQGKATYLISGDNRATAAAIAAAAGIRPDRVFAEVRPDRKAAILAELQRTGQRVAFVGDGINDAPALEQADLGIAVSRASDVAREAADIILLRSEIEAIPEAIGLAQATLRAIKQNLFWAFFYNAAAVPLAALGFLIPVMCAAAMGLSDVLVIGNALRLRAWRCR